MTQAKFIHPMLAALPDISYSSTQAEFLDELTFGTGNPSLVQQGPYPFSSGRPGGAGSAFCFTHDDIVAGGDVSENEILFIMPGIAAAVSTAWFGVRCPAAYASGTQPNGSIFAYITADGVELARKSTGGSQAQLGIVNLTAAGKNRWPLACRIRVTGTGTVTAQMRVWPADEPEPSTWDVDTTYTSTNDTGVPMAGRSGTGWPAHFSHISFGAGEPAPSLFGSISGNVFVAPDTGVARTVRAVAREDDRLVFETTSESDGSYTIMVLLGYTYSVFAIDDTYNAAIKDRITPVDPDA